MRLSTRSIYGLRAVLNLATHYGEGTLTASQIARDEKIPVPYLEQILYRLKKRHWIRSVRGPSGGYRLAKPPSEIKVGEILRVLEGEDFSFRRAKEPLRDGSSRRVEIAANLFWDKLSQVFTSTLDNTSLKSLIDEAAHIQKSRSGATRVDFSI